ncbi:MAG: hypothetical protein P4L82_10155 [Ancalomicrobiaceae bacterium]|nr:hypothetical protein [Ancalomicrobiaceae bacterium]
MAGLESDREEKIIIEYAKFAHVETIEVFRAVKEFSSYAIRMMFLVNGGAIIALLALAGNIVGKANTDNYAYYSKYSHVIVCSLVFFLAGIVFAGFATLFAYLNFSFLQAVVPSSGDILSWLRGNEYKTNSVFQKWVRWSAWGGVITGLISLASFASGGIYMLSNVFNL